MVNAGMTQNKMKNIKVAITGGIGSGKSEISKIIKNKGYTVISADETAKNIMRREQIKTAIAEKFCLKTDENNNYNKAELAKIIFNDKDSLNWLNSYIHPLIVKEIFEILDRNNGLVFAEIPLLFESGTEKLFDKIIIVKRNSEQRIKSVMARDNLSREEVEKRIKNQYNYENLANIGHTIIYNDSDLEKLNKQVEILLNEMENKIL